MSFFNFKKNRSRVSKLLGTLLILSLVLLSFIGVFQHRNHKYIIKVCDNAVSLKMWENLKRRNNIARDSKDDQELQLAQDTVDKFILYEEAKKLGFMVTKDVVLSEILKIPLFFQEGRFSKKLFTETLKFSQITEDEFMSDMKMTLVIQKLYLDSFSHNALAFPYIVSSVLREVSKTKKVEVLEIPFYAVSLREPLSTELSELFKETEHIAPGRATVSYAVLNPPVSTQNITTENDLRKLYDKNKYIFKVSEERLVNRICFSSLKNAHLAMQNLKSGVNFEEIITKYPKFNATISEKILIKDSNSELGREIFALSKGDFSRILETPTGACIFKIIDVTGSRIKSFDEIKDKITAALLNEEKKRKLVAHISDVHDSIGQNDSFDTIIKKFKLKSHRYTITQDNSIGLLPDGIDKSDIRKIAFSDQKAVHISYIKKIGQHYVINIDHVEPRTVEKISNSQNRLKDLFKSRELDKQLRKISLEIKHGNINWRNGINAKIFSFNDIRVINFLTNSKKTGDNLPSKLLSCIEDLKLGQLSPPYLDKVNKKIYFAAVTQEDYLKTFEKLKAKAFYARNIASVENEEIKNSLLVELRKKYQKKIYNGVNKKML
jgi:hypothetical protein